jgi:glycosyltransferase involved in cell wall biosynthesis
MTTMTRHAEQAARGRPAPRVVLVHDYLTQRGGAERVALSMMRAFPDAPFVTSLYDPRATFPEFRDKHVETMPVNRLVPLRHHHRMALPLLAPAFSGISISADVVVCSSSGWAHGIHTDGRKLVYCHTPARWLYEPAHYLPGHGRTARWAMQALRRPLMRWDRRAADSAHRYLVNSRLVQRRVWRVYGIDAEILPPPHTVDVTAPQLPVDGIEPGYYLSVARLSGYKHVDAVVEAFGDLPADRLVVAGSGPERQRLERRAGPNVCFLGAVGDDKLRWLYANCRGLVAASYEDFGLTPLECAAFGRPAAVLRWGGYLETLIEGVTGVSFPVPQPDAIRDAVRRLGRGGTDEQALREHAARYSEARFVDRLRRCAFET